ncbi:unnamed protein product [Prorocentrum cordatum]|uniref:Uncharacterized protein n=1 Tax=Prorocentrum cordatum TaxID=2364126 RepID=A0ABN9X4S7_9DINO|nr:unnamed protein product [Polarella glacialis]
MHGACSSERWCVKKHGIDLSDGFCLCRFTFSSSGAVLVCPARWAHVLSCSFRDRAGASSPFRLLHAERGFHEQDCPCRIEGSRGDPFCGEPARAQAIIIGEVLMSRALLRDIVPPGGADKF